MAKQTKKEDTPQVVYQNHKWVTSDGLCFNTQDKAWKHAREINQVTETKNNE